MLRYQGILHVGWLGLTKVLEIISSKEGRFMSDQGVGPWCSGSFLGASDDGDYHGEEQSCPHKGGKERKGMT